MFAQDRSINLGLFDESPHAKLLKLNAKTVASVDANSKAGASEIVVKEISSDFCLLMW